MSLIQKEIADFTVQCYQNNALQKSPPQPHLHAVLAPPCRSFSPTFTH